jgi:prolyl 4-hydroxylase
VLDRGVTGEDLPSLQVAAENGDPNAQLALSQALERQRRRDEARVWLRRAAEAGHPLAQTILGARLLSGDGRADAWSEGVGLILAAHEEGVADATTMIAVLTAMGAGVKQDWTHAFDLLQLAAERGSARGRAQLIALGRELGSRAADEDWAGLRAALSPDPWRTAPAAETLSASPQIVVYRRFVSPAACAWMVARAGGRVARAQVFDPVTGKGRVERDRNNSAFQFNAIEFDFPIALTRARITAATGAVQERMEPPQILNYQTGETFAPHFDFLDSALPGPARDIAERGQRSMTFLIYLNDDFDGGETDFPELGLRFRGRTGDAILFHNLDTAGKGDPRTRHAGLPPTQGEKWLFSQWIRDRAPSPPP